MSTGDGAPTFPRPASHGAEFRLSRTEPSQGLLWTAGAMMLALLMAWFGGKLDLQYLLIFGAIFVVAYFASLHDETTAEEDRTVKLRISADGIEIPDRFAGAIDWESIETLGMNTYKGSTTLRLVPLDPQAHGLGQQSGWSRFLHGAGVTYDITGLEGDPDDVSAAIRRYGPSRLANGL